MGHAKPLEKGGGGVVWRGYAAGGPWTVVFVGSIDAVTPFTAADLVLRLLADKRVPLRNVGRLFELLLESTPVLILVYLYKTNRNY